ncbi:MAG: DUF1987 domain-containing protein [Bacteroidales bacterium]|nr:DUF1987 domain-containing protein [Bacteroidales bacterium]
MDKNIFSFTNNCLTENDIPGLLHNVLETVRKENISHVAINSTRTIISEILSNIVGHAYLDKDQASLTLNLSVTDEGNVKINTRNFIQNKDISQFTILLNKMNLLSIQELRKLQQETLEKNLEFSGTAGIGLIMIRRRTCKPIVCKFEPINDEISHLDLEMEICANLSEDLKKDKTQRTPQVTFDISKQHFEISGVSYPEDAEAYYSEIEKWIVENEEHISDLQNPVLKIDLDYFNSISLKNIVRTVRDLLETNKDQFTVNWYYDVDDEISYEEGVEMSEILHKPFNFIQKN